MFVQISAEAVPRSLRGVLLADSNHIPRYWPSVWLVVAASQWATSTQTMRLRYIENLYEHADRSFRANALDDALSSLDDARLGGYLNRKHDRPLGPTVMWRGFRALHECTE